MQGLAQKKIFLCHDTCLRAIFDRDNWLVAYFRAIVTVACPAYGLNQ